MNVDPAGERASLTIVIYLPTPAGAVAALLAVLAEQWPDAGIDTTTVGGWTITADVADVADGPHSRACGWRRHPHGADCSSNCPTCHGAAVAR